jgi:tricorn protease interacting factor F2/3
MMKGWIEQEGYPLVEATRTKDKLVLRQERFTYLDEAPGPEWMIPVTVRVFNEKGDATESTTLFETKTTEVEIGTDAVAYKVNWGQTGFYRVKYDDRENLANLGRRISQRQLPPEDRWGVQNDLYALAKSGDFPVGQYLDFIAYYTDEDAFLPLIGIAHNLFQIYLVMEGDTKERAASLGKELLEKVLQRIGYEPAQEENHTTSMLRDQVILPAVVYGLKDAADFGARRFDSLRKGEPVHPDIMRSVMQVGAWTGGGEAFRWFEKRLQSAESEHERMNILTALGSFRDREWIQKARRYILEEVPDRNKFVPVCHMAFNPHAIPDMWEWYVSSLNVLEHLHPVHYERVIAAIVPVCGIGKEEQIQAFFEASFREKDKAKQAIRLALEKLAIYSRMRGSP